MRGAHPRSRGENIPGRTGDDPGAGSSPLTRGKPGRAQSSATNHGLIPAHAGKTIQALGAAGSSRAHPRSRGENFIMSSHASATAGSSPLTRGKHPHVGGGACQGGLIPAHAGKTSRRASRLAVPRAHPRSRGENIKASVAACCASGSSPLTRGKRYRRWPGLGGVRLIPAHAGKTRAEIADMHTRAAHPRSRGENIRPIGLASIAAGSSPLTRGKPQSPGVLSATRRLIPAHAGKTWRPRT